MHAAFAEKADIDASAGERGVLQLVFDVEYLRRAFGGSDGRFATSRVTSKVTAAANGASSFAEAEREAAARAFARARDALARRLDPIDWATYEAPLGDAARRAEARTATLLGALRDLLGQARRGGPSALDRPRGRRLRRGRRGAAVLIPPREPSREPSFGRRRDVRRRVARSRGGDRLDGGRVGPVRRRDGRGGRGNVRRRREFPLGKLGQGLGLGKASMAWGL